MLHSLNDLAYRWTGTPNEKWYISLYWRVPFYYLYLSKNSWHNLKRSEYYELLSIGLTVIVQHLVVGLKLDISVAAR